MKLSFRPDIDAIRALAVATVLLFHFHLVPFGYLGVDVFFVISGYLMGRIIIGEVRSGHFSVGSFYERRFRRIVPLVTVVCLTSLIAGYFLMLPDDLENLAQSVIATTFVSNNILQAITTRNYWDVVNDYKPLLHTWSLGIEEQFYIALPFLIFVGSKLSPSTPTRVVATLTILSLVAYLVQSEAYVRFYWIWYRLWELGAGVWLALVVHDKARTASVTTSLLARVAFVLLVVLLFSPADAWSERLAPFAAVAFTLSILAYGLPIPGGRLGQAILWLGSRSFGIYMWHQPVLAFGRYAIFETLSATNLLYVTCLTLLLAELSYRMIETPFRQKAKVRRGFLYSSVGGLAGACVLASVAIYFAGGVVRAVPELGISPGEGSKSVHAAYNDRIHSLDRRFDQSATTKRVLVVGDSFARDWANVLLESSIAEHIQISYVYVPNLDQPTTQMRAKVAERVLPADRIFVSIGTREQVHSLNIPLDRLYVIGDKNFGRSNGLHYNYRGDDYFLQRASASVSSIARNTALGNEWNDRFIDYYKLVLDDNGRVPVFTPDRHFISQDTRHFTKAGAKHFAVLFDAKLAHHLGLGQ